MPVDVPPAAALDAINLAASDGRSAKPADAGDVAPMAAEPTEAAPVSAARADAPVHAGPGRLGPGEPTPADAGPAWPITGPGGPGTSSAGRLPAQVISGSILPGAERVTVAGTGTGSEAVDEAVAGPSVFLVDASRAVLAWARRRQVGLSSATGIAVALSGCAAAWFSAGTRADTIRGVVALWCGYLVLAAGQSITRRAAWQQDEPAAERRVAGPVRWLAALGGSAVEAVAYAGLVVGAAAQRYPGMWALGIGVLGLVAARNLMTACSTPYGLPEARESLLGRGCAGVVTMAPGGRILLVGVVAPVWGGRTTLLLLLAWAISTVGYGLAGRAAPSVETEPGGADGAGSVVAAASLIRLRDDGALARGLGAIVRGNLLPLPPAILGLAAVSALSVIGLHGRPGPLMMAPAIVMLLAAPGSANPHAGRFDWLVPVLLFGTQVLYLAAIGAGGRVSGPVVFVLVAALLLHYTDLACPQRPILLARPRRGGGPREYGTALGWDGRVLFAGLTAAMGIATAGFLVLTAYLAVVIGAKVVRSGVLSPEDDRD